MAAFTLILILLIFGLLAGGIVLLVIGFIRKKVALWVPGLIMVSLVLIAFLFSIVFSIRAKFNLAKNFYENEVPYWDKDRYDSNRPNYGDFRITESDSLKNIFDNPVAGYIEDTDHSQVLIKVFPDKYLKNHGVVLKNVGKPSNPEKQSAIALELDFSREFNGHFMLRLFDGNSEELDNNVLAVSQEAGSNVKLEFSISSKVSRTGISYCTLTAIE